MKAIHRLLDLNSNKNVKVIGIWARAGNERSALAKFVYENISEHFESHCFLENVKRISQHGHMSHLHEEFLRSVKRISQDRHKESLESVKKIYKDRHMSHLDKEFLIWIQGQSLSESRLMNEKVLLVADDVSKSRLKNQKVLLVADDVSKSRLKNQKVLLVADDVDKLEQLEALADDFNNFGPGSRVIIATQDKQLLKSSGITLVYEAALLRFQIAPKLFIRQSAFNKRDISDTLFKAKKWLGCSTL